MAREEISDEDIEKVIAFIKEIYERKKKKKSRYKRLYKWKKERYHYVPIRKDLYVIIKSLAEKKNLTFNDMLSLMVDTYIKYEGVQI